MAGFILVMFFLVIYLVVSDYRLRKKFSIQKRGEFFYRQVNKIHFWAEIILLIIALPVIGFLAGIGFFPAILIFFVFLYGLRGWMEWKYEKEEKNYILTLNGFVAFIIAAAATTIFYFLG